MRARRSDGWSGLRVLDGADLVLQVADAFGEAVAFEGEFVAFLLHGLELCCGIGGVEEEDPNGVAVLHPVNIGDGEGAGGISRGGGDLHPAE